MPRMSRRPRPPDAGSARPSARGRLAGIAFHPATPSRWSDVAALFGERGACAGCWCMYLRRPRAQWNAGRGAGNRRALRALIESGGRPGVIACAAGEPVGWCAVAPRADYGGLARSRVLAPVDDRPVWSISCLFVRRDWRRRGLSSRLIEEAARFAARRGAAIVEGYPVETSGAKSADAFIWTGSASAFRAARFREVARRSPTRPIMRRRFRVSRS
jgi:GNAT superfamily N-acetyltransferase